MPLLQKLIDQNANQNKGKKVFQIEKKQTFFLENSNHKKNFIYFKFKLF